jgi:hypothetical protein
MRARIMRLLPVTAVVLLGLAGAAAPAGAARVARTVPPVTVYVASSFSGDVTPIRVATSRPGRAINTHGADSITATPDGRTVYVGSLGATDTVTPIRTATNKAGRAIKVGGADDLLVTPDGKTLYAVGVLGNWTGIRIAGVIRHHHYRRSNVDAGRPICPDFYHDHGISRAMRRWPAGLLLWGLNFAH